MVARNRAINFWVSIVMAEFVKITEHKIALHYTHNLNVYEFVVAG